MSWQHKEEMVAVAVETVIAVVAAEVAVRR
jgi:hypothetical protein